MSTDNKFVTVHGGDLDTIERIYKIPRNELVDFSGNINPLGLPKSVYEVLLKNIDIITTYPDKNYVKLKEAIAKYASVCEDSIVVGNGSTELISYFIRNINPKNSIIIGPAYSEYERELKLINKQYSYFPLLEIDDFIVDDMKLIDVLTDNVELLILTNPNNPTGSYIPKEKMERILNHCKKQGIFVLVDETYAEFSSHDVSSIAFTKEYDNLFVIRGTSKFFACPGIRLGYGIGQKRVLDIVNKMKDPWSVNSLANIGGITMFSDNEFISKTKAFILKEKEKFYNELDNIKDIKYYKSESNFILCKILTDKYTAKDVFDKGIARKLLIRNASSFNFLDETYFRFCILSEKDNEDLIAVLKEL